MVVLSRTEVGKFNIDYSSTLSILLFMLGTESHRDIWRQGVRKIADFTFMIVTYYSLRTFD